MEEVSALIDKKTLLEIYNIAIEEPYSFLYVKLNVKKEMICSTLSMIKK